MHQATVHQHFRTLRSRGAALRVCVTSLPSRDFVQLRPARLTPKNRRAKYIDLPMGVIWRHNWKLAEMSNKKSGDMVFDCLYDLRDSGKHTVKGYGLGKSNPHGELSQLQVDALTAKRYAEYLRRTKAFTPDDAKPLELLYAELIAMYGAKRDEHKVTARDRWIRGAVTKDSLGKENPMAAALVTYAGIRILLKREDALPPLSTAVDRKTLLVDAYIQDHIELFQELWDALRMSAHKQTRGAFQRLLDNAESDRPMQRSQRGQAIRALIDLLTGFNEALGRVVARPFSRNASHTRKDIAQAISLAQSQDFAGVRRQITKIRQGIRWVFVLDHLREKVITPLSFLVAHLHDKEAARRRTERRKLLASGQQLPPAKREPIRVTREMAPLELDAIEKALNEFLAKLEQCSDADLETKVKSAVEAHARDALRAMEADRWVLAKKRLRVAAKKL